MAKTFAVTAVLNATLTLQTAGVEEYSRAIREAAKSGGLPGGFGDKLVALLDKGDDEKALALLFKHGIRSGLKDLGEQLNNELIQDSGKFTHAPATVAITPQININRPAANDEE